MYDSVRNADADRVTYDLVVEGTSHPEVIVKRITVDTEVNKLPRAYVTCDDGDASEETFPLSESDTLKPGAKLELKLGYHSHNDSVFKGVILGQTLRRHPDGETEVVIICGDRAETLSLRSGRHAFFEATDADAIEKLVSEAGLNASVEGATLPCPAQVQAPSSDWDFIVARAQANGLVVKVQDGKLMIAPPGKGDAAYQVVFGDTIAEMDLSVDASHQLAGVTTQSWDPKTQAVVTNDAAEPSLPKIGLDDGAAAADFVGAATPVLTTPLPMDDKALKQWADARLLTARLSLYQGRIQCSGVAALTAGDVLHLQGLGKRFNGTGYVSRVVQVLEAGNWQTEVHMGLPHGWLADRGGGVSTPGAAGLRPAMTGLDIATVLKTDEDPEGERRIQVTYPLNADTAEGVWVRLASFYATQDKGAVFMPEVGDEVVLGFLGGDPNAGVVLGALQSSARPAPLVPDPENTQKAITTRSGLTIGFDDEKAILTLTTPGGHKATFDDEAKAVTIEDTNGNKIALEESGLTLTSPKDMTLKADGAVSIEGQSGITIKSPADVGIEGSNSTLKGQIDATIDGGASATLSGGGQATVKAGMVMIN